MKREGGGEEGRPDRDVGHRFGHSAPKMWPSHPDRAERGHRNARDLCDGGGKNEAQKKIARGDLVEALLEISGHLAG